MSGGAYGPRVMEHFRRPRNRGSLAAPTVSGEGTNPLCGDRVRIELAIAEGTVNEAGFTADGCALCIASASALTELVGGRPVGEALAVEESRVLEALEATVPDARRQCIGLPVTVLRQALAGWRGGDG